jgi:hypothetical protein
MRIDIVEMMGKQDFRKEYEREAILWILRTKPAPAAVLERNNRPISPESP